MKHTCLNCHFLGKRHNHLEPDEGVPFILPYEDRDQLKNGNFGAIHSGYSLTCLKHVWDQQIYNKDKSLEDLVCGESRNDRCFFYKYDLGVSFQAAEELQKRLEENQQLKKSNRYTVIGLWIASFALLVNAIATLISLFKHT